MKNLLPCSVLAAERVAEDMFYIMESEKNSTEFGEYLEKKPEK
jgi:hypothetical protein